MARIGRWSIALVLAIASASVLTARAEVTSGAVERAIRDGIRFMRHSQTPDGSWPGAGVTELATLALLTAGVPRDDPDLARALAVVRQHTPETILARPQDLYGRVTRDGARGRGPGGLPRLDRARRRLAGVCPDAATTQSCRSAGGARGDRARRGLLVLLRETNRCAATTRTRNTPCSA